MQAAYDPTKFTFGALLGENKFGPTSSPQLRKKQDDQLELDLEMQLDILQKKILSTPPLKSRFGTPHRQKASQILRALRNPSKQIKRPQFSDDGERVLTYELTISILKYFSFLKDALDASSFAERYPQLMKYGLEEVMVTMYDLLERNFRISPLDSQLSKKFSLLQDAVLDSRTKVMAHMARLRIKHEAATLEYLLPEKLRHQQHIDKNPLYIWVNLKKSNCPEIIEVFQQTGLKGTNVEDDILIQEESFCTDANHEDLIRLHSKSLGIINSKTNLVRNGKIVIQDKSACMYVYALVKALYFKESLNLEGHLQTRSRYLQNPQAPAEWFEGIFDAIGNYISKPNCVVVTHAGSGRSVAHLACLLQEAVPRYISQNIKINSQDSLAQVVKKRFTRRPPLNVIAFGVPADRLEEVTAFVKKQMNIHNIKLFSEDFIDIEPTDPRIAGCCAILVNPPSSGSALKDPVAYVCSEGGDENVLMHLSRFVHSSRDGHGTLPTQEQKNFLKHALSFPQAKLILYTTCSVLSFENSDVVNYCLQNALDLEEKRKIRILQDIVRRKGTRNYRDIDFELVDMQSVLANYPKAFFKGKLLDKGPCSASSGVFLALIRRTEKIITVSSKNSSKSSGETVPSTTTTTEEAVTLEDNLNASAKSILQNFSSGKISEKQLEMYLAKQRLIDNSNSKFNSNPLSKRSSTDLVSTLQASVSLKAQKDAKKGLTHKAIVRRVSTPTHASLAKQKEKWLNPYERTKKGTEAWNASTSSLNRRGRKEESSASMKTLCSKCNPGYNLDHSCVCARHAKKFPDYHGRA